MARGGRRRQVMVEIGMRERVGGNAADVLSHLQQQLLHAAEGGLLSDDLADQTEQHGRRFRRGRPNLTWLPGQNVWPIGRE